MKAVKDKNQWQLKYIRAILGANAWPDAFPDADRGFGGETDIQSHEVIFNYALNKNVLLGLDYYQSTGYADSAPTNRSDNTENIIQADLLFKF